MATAGSRGWILVAGLGALALLALNLAWLHHFRAGYLTEYDESGYLAIALDDAHALQRDGPVAFARTVERQGTQAPLVPLSAVPALLLGGDPVIGGLATLAVWLSLLGLATFALARRVVAPAWAALAALVAATVPEALDYARLFHFSVPATTFFTLAAWALLGSDRLRRRPFVVAAGLALGLMVLARSMTISYLPGFALVAGVWLVADDADRRRRLMTALVAAIAGGILAAVWYLPNLHSVGSYLLHFGYGAESAGYGARRSPLSVGYWTKEGRVLVEGLYLPLALVLLAGMLLLATRAAHLRSGWRVIALTPHAALALLVLEAYLALTSSRNVGSAFSLPWIPALVVLAIAGFAAVGARPLRVAAATAAVLVAAFGLATKSWDPAPLPARAGVDLPAWGSVPVADASSAIWREVVGAGLPAGEPGQRLPARDRGWLPAARRMAAFARARTPGRSPLLAFGSDDPLLSGTRVQLVSRLHGDPVVRTATLLPFRSGDDASGYRRQLLAVRPDAIVTGEPRTAPGQLGISRPAVEAAARALGYVPRLRLHTPDGRPTVVWVRR